jgi:hypothetical protein
LRKNSHENSILLISGVLLGASACSESVKTIEEWDNADLDAFIAQVKKCRGNPGQLKEDGIKRMKEQIKKPR